MNKTFKPLDWVLSKHSSGYVVLRVETTRNQETTKETLPVDQGPLLPAIPGLHKLGIFTPSRQEYRGESRRNQRWWEAGRCVI